MLYEPELSGSFYFTMLHPSNQSLTHVLKREIIWENPSVIGGISNAAFAGQTLNLDLSDADEIEIQCCISNLANNALKIHRFVFLNGLNATISQSLQGAGNYNTLYVRQFMLYTNKIVISNGAVQASTDVSSINNNSQVPFKIIKIKY